MGGDHPFWICRLHPGNTENGRVLPSLVKFYGKRIALKERAPEIAAGNLLSQVFTTEVNRLSELN